MAFGKSAEKPKTLGLRLSQEQRNTAYLDCLIAVYSAYRCDNMPATPEKDFDRAIEAVDVFMARLDTLER